MIKTGHRLIVNSKLMSAAGWLTRDTGFRSLEPGALRVRAELERPRGDEAARRRASQDAHRSLVEIGATVRAARVAEGMRA